MLHFIVAILFIDACMRWTIIIMHYLNGGGQSDENTSET